MLTLADSCVEAAAREAGAAAELAVTRKVMKYALVNNDRLAQSVLYSCISFLLQIYSHMANMLRGCPCSSSFKVTPVRWSVYGKFRFRI